MNSPVFPHHGRRNGLPGVFSLDLCDLFDIIAVEIKQPELLKPLSTVPWRS